MVSAARHTLALVGWLRSVGPVRADVDEEARMVGRGHVIKRRRAWGFP